MKKLFKLALAAAILLTASQPAMADRRNFYHRVDIASGNIYSFVVSNLVTSFGNYFCRDILFDNSFNYSIMTASTSARSSAAFKPENPLGLTARSLFNDAAAGLKLGYNSDNFGSFNWGIYACGHYKINQYQGKFNNAADYSHERFSYVKPGLGAFVLFGSLEQKLRVQLEVSAAYCIPLDYHGIRGTSTDVLNRGIASHYALKFGGAYDFSGGVFVDVNHFKIFKTDVIKSFNMCTVGITLTITPKRGERLYD